MPYIRKYIENIAFKQNTKCCFTLWFYNVIKTMDKRKEEDESFPRKKTKEKQNGVTIMISVNGKGTIYPVKLKLEGEPIE